MVEVLLLLPEAEAEAATAAMVKGIQIIVTVYNIDVE